MRLDTSDIIAIKHSTAAAYEACGGVLAAARRLGVASSTLTKYASPSQEWHGNVIRLDLAVALDRAAGHGFLRETYDRLVKQMGEAIDAASEAGASAFDRLSASAVLRLDAVLSDVVRETAQAIDDGMIDAAERLAIRRRIVAAQQALSRLDLKLCDGGGI